MSSWLPFFYYFERLLSIHLLELTKMFGQYVNRTWCQVLGYKTEDILNHSLYSFHQLGNMDQVTKQLEKGFDWEGKISWRSKSGENIALQCRAMPFQAAGRYLLIYNFLTTCYLCALVYKNVLWILNFVSNIKVVHL